MMNFLTIIPARQNSIRIRNKNLRVVKKKPLIYYTIKEAKKSKYLNLDMFYFMKRYLKTFKYVYIAKWYFTYLINIIFKINLFK